MLTHMDFRTAFFKPCAFALLSLWCGAAQAGEAFDAQYNFRWGSMKVGTAHVHYEAIPARFAISSEAKSAGVARVFSSHESQTKVSGTRPAQDGPRSFSTHYSTDGAAKSVEMDYAKDGKMTREIVLPDRQSSRPLVPEASKRGTRDLLTALFALPELMAEAQNEKSPLFSQRIYDGKQLYQLDFTLTNGLQRLKTGKTQFNAWDVVVTRKLLDGITAKERKRANKSEPPMHLYLGEKSFPAARHVAITLRHPVFRHGGHAVPLHHLRALGLIRHLRRLPGWPRHFPHFLGGGAVCAFPRR